MPTFIASKGLELRRKLEERDRKGSRRRRWQVKTLFEWFGLGGKRLTQGKLLTLQKAMDQAGIEAAPGVISQSGLKDRVNLIVKGASTEPASPEPEETPIPKPATRKTRPKPPAPRPSAPPVRPVRAKPALEPPAGFPSPGADVSRVRQRGRSR